MLDTSRGVGGLFGAHTISALLATPLLEVRAMDSGFSSTVIPLADADPSAQRAAVAVGNLARYAPDDPREQEARTAHDEARDAILSYADVLRRERVAPERALAMIKTVVLGPASAMTTNARDALTADVLHWFIDAYYRPRVRPVEEPRPGA